MSQVVQLAGWTPIASPRSGSPRCSSTLAEMVSELKTY